MTLQEQIRIVAEYDGKVVRDFGIYGIRYTHPYFKNDAYYDWSMLHTLTYHTSYDALMPIVNKVILELAEINSEGLGEAVNDAGVRIDLSFWDISKLFTTTVQAIELLNKYKDNATSN